MKNKKIKLIYIVGGGHSGSTILSFLIGSDNNSFNSGELKYFHSLKKNTYTVNYMKNYCSCGSKADKCNFWKKIESKTNKIEIYHHPKKTEIIKLFLNILTPFYKIKRKAKNDDDYILLNILLKESKKKYVVDSSKSLDRLVHLYKNKNLDIKIIYLIRDGRGYVNSYRKAYKKGFIIWVLQWIILNFFTQSFIRKYNVDHLYITYRDLCDNTTKVLKKINKKFQTNIPKDYVSAVRKTKSHVRAGNPKKSKIKKFKGMKYDEKWKKELNAIQKLISTIILYPFNKHWLNK